MDVEKQLAEQRLFCYSNDNVAGINLLNSVVFIMGHSNRLWHDFSHSCAEISAKFPELTSRIDSIVMEYRLNDDNAIKEKNAKIKSIKMIKAYFNAVEKMFELLEVK
jgi:hypothetical protein